MAQDKQDVKKIHYELGAALDEKRKIRILTEVFERRVGYPLDLENPRTMNEKIVWLKLFYQDPLITRCADKFAVKDYVREVVGEEYVVPLLAAWSDPDEIDFDALPDRFVLKVNWSRGYNIIVRDKSKLDVEKTREKLRSWIQPGRSAYYQYFNWGFRHMKPVICAEQYLARTAAQRCEYKFFFSHERFLHLLIETDRWGEKEATGTFFDERLQKIPCTYGGKPNADPALPKHLDKMLELAGKLAKPFPYARADFYEIGDAIYLNEMTFYPGGGLRPFDPPEWDRILGDQIPLPEKRIIDREDFAFRVRSLLKRVQLKLSGKLP